MRVGTVKERRQGERRVALAPSGVRTLVGTGNEVFVERGAGSGAGFANEEYLLAGANVVDDPASVWRASELVVKVKELAHRRSGSRPCPD